MNLGQIWRGVIKINHRMKHRAFVQIKELDIDVMIEGQQCMNRAFDGDTVLIELLPIPQWVDINDQNGMHAKISSINQQTGEVTLGINHLRPNKAQLFYTNEDAIEKRIVDKTDQLSMSQSQSEDDAKLKH